MPTLTPMSFVALIAAAQRHDQAALEALYRQYDEALYRYLAARCGDSALAEELLGDVWVRVLEYLPRFRLPDAGGELAFQAWLYQIARNRMINNREQRKVRRTVPLEEHIPSDAPALADAVEQQEAQVELRQALRNLTQDQREVVLLRFVERRTSMEVATLTGRSQTAVKALQHRALATLARLLGVQQKVNQEP